MDTLNFAVDINRFGFMGTPETSISFDGTSTFTLTALSGTWSYYRSGVKHTITGNKTKVLATPMVDNTLYFIYIDSTDGTLVSSTSNWTLNDTKVLVATIYWKSTLTPKFIMCDERHTCLVDRRWHREHHLTEGTQIISGGTISAMTVNSTTPTNKVFGVVETTIVDEDNFFTLAALTKPDGATAVYYNFYRTSVTAGAVLAKWDWLASDMPFKYAVLSGTPTYDEAEYDLNGTSTPATAGRYINTYVIMTNSVNSAETFPNSTADTRFMIVQGRVNASTTTAAYAESFGSLDMSGFPVAEAVAVYQLTWQCDQANTVKGRCTLTRAQKISVNIIQTTIAASMDHNTLGGLQGGAIGEYFHLTQAVHDALLVSGGTAGTSGSSGTSGTSGSSGTSGTTGSSGTSGFGTSGTSGATGSSGTSGPSGTSGTSSTSGTSGNSISVGAYIFTQAAPSSTWNVVHNLGTKYVNVTCVGTDDKVIIPASITFTDLNNLVITFPAAIAGYANISSGGLAGTAGTSGTSGTTGTSGSSGLSGVPTPYINTYSSVTWVATHNLNATSVMVQCWNADASPVVIVPASIIYDSVNQVTISWNGASVAGKVCVIKLF